MTGADRHVRVFVSSTFRDMKAERDHLVKVVFPQLRKLCESRGVVWGEVDLRWGITEEESREGQVLPLCLEEIRRCRPYFLGILGHSYGSLPTEVRPELLEREPWLREHVEGRRSITELEILHGVLNDPAMAEHAFFYFRSPEASKALGLPEPGDADARKLEDLKERIRRSGFPVRENFADAGGLGGHVLADMTRVIDARFPEGSKPSDLDREARDHEIFAESRARVYVGRKEYMDRLDRHVASEDPPLVVLGESGIGKSALLANWFLGYRAKHPNDFALIHFIGATRDSADASSIMRRIMLELKRRFELREEVPPQVEKIREQFPQWLANAAGSGRVVLVLDGLNQLDHRDNAPDLGWLPLGVLSNARLIVSTLPGRSLEALQRRECQRLTVQPLAAQERRQLLAEFLVQFRKSLSAERVTRIASAPQCANPLFLRAMLDELRQFGEHDRLGERIDHYLGAKGPKELYELILDRWAADFSAGKDLVRRTMRLLWAARRGLSEAELLELLNRRGEPLPRAQWTPLFLSAESSLANRSGLLAFFHDYVREAAWSRFLGTADAERASHRALADHFAGEPELTPRKLDELPWQLQRAEEWERLKDLLTALPVFMRLRSEEQWKWELHGYWLELQSRYDATRTYAEAARFWEGVAGGATAYALAINRLAQFHYERAEHVAAERLLRRALAILDGGDGREHANTASALNNLAMLLQATNRLAEAEPVMRRALAIDERIHGKDHPDVALCLNNLATLLQATNRLAEAEPLMRRALAILEVSLGREHQNTAGAINNLAMLLRATNRLAEAESLTRRALAIDEKRYGKDHPAVATNLNNLATVLQASNRLVEAEPLARRALAIDERIYGKDHPDVARDLGNLASLLHATNRLAEAESLTRRALAIDERIYGKEHPSVATRLSNLALLLQATNRLAEAERLMRRALAIDEESYGKDHPNVAIRLNNLATLLQATSRLAEAEPLMRRALAIDERSHGKDHPEVAQDLNNLATLLQATNRLAQAEPLMRRALAINERSHGKGHPSVATALSNLAELLHATNRLAEAEPLARRALAIDEESYGKDHPNVAIRLNNLATLLQATNRLAEAEPLMRRALSIIEGSLGRDHPNTARALNNLAMLLRATNRVAEAEPLMRRALAIDERSYGKDHALVAGGLYNLASLLHATNRLTEAEPMLRRALAIDERSQGRDHPDVARDLYYLSGLLRATNRRAEAEPLMRRAVGNFLAFTARTGQHHPQLQGAVGHYARLLGELGLSEPQVRKRLGDLLGEHGISLG